MAEVSIMTSPAPATAPVAVVPFLDGHWKLTAIVAKHVLEVLKDISIETLVLPTDSVEREETKIAKIKIVLVERFQDYDALPLHILTDWVCRLTRVATIYSSNLNVLDDLNIPNTVCNITKNQAFL